MSDPSFKGRLNDIARIRRAHKGTDADLASKIATLIWDWEAKDGSLWVLDDTKVPYLLLRTGVSLPVSRKSQRFCEYAVYHYGLAQSDRLTPLVIDFLVGQVAHESNTIETARFSYWDRAEQTLYVSLYNGNAVKITGDDRFGIQAVPNGTRVLFLDDDGGTMPDPDRTFQAGSLREVVTGSLSLTDSFGASVESQKDLAYLWMLSSCFPQYFPNKPLGIFSGDYGSGKTTAVGNFQLILQGLKKIHTVQKSDEPDFYIKLIRSQPICLLDQLDTFYPWLADILCGYATGGTWERRKFYNQLDSLIIQPQSFVGITTRNPSNFSRVDLADRSVFFAFKRIEEAEGFHDDGAMTLKLLEMRPKLIGELFVTLHKIVARLKNAEAKRSPYRMSRFANFCLLAGPAAGIPLERVEKALEEAEKARQVISGAANPLITMVEVVLARYGHESISGTASEILENHLGPELRVRGMKMPDPRRLGKALSAERQREEGPLDIVLRQIGGGKHHYTIKLRDSSN